MPNARCPCGAGVDYLDCCAPLHNGERAAVTALALMRARFSAFALGNAAYLLESWHPETRPRTVEFDDAVTWRRLQIVDTNLGGPADTEGFVEFRASYQHRGSHQVLHERSRFTRIDGRWVYLDGDVTDSDPR